jgi:hypothetical protein
MGVVKKEKKTRDGKLDNIKTTRRDGTKRNWTASKQIKTMTTQGESKLQHCLSMRTHSTLAI